MCNLYYNAESNKKAKCGLVRKNINSFFGFISSAVASVTFKEWAVYLFNLLIVSTYFYPDNVIYPIFSYLMQTVSRLFEIVLLDFLVKLVWWVVTLPHFPVMFSIVLIGVITKYFKNLIIYVFYFIMIVYVVSAMSNFPMIYYQF